MNLKIAPVNKPILLGPSHSAGCRLIAIAILIIVHTARIEANPGPLVPTTIGPTGGFGVPSPLTMPPERTAVAVHFEAFNQFSESTLDIEPTVHMSPKVVVGIYDYLEVGLEKTFKIHSENEQETIYANIKYRFPFDSMNVAVGAIVPLTPPDWTSAYMVMGWKALWAGFGVNLGGRRFRELTLNNFQSVGVARMGGYTLRRRVVDGSDQFTGEPDAFFGLVGFNHRLGKHLEVVADYNGDRVSAGFRIPFHSWNVDLIYVSQAATDSLFSRETQNYQIGVTGRF